MATPPEVAAAYRIDDNACDLRFRPGLEGMDLLAGRADARAAGPPTAAVEHDLHLGHHRQPEGGEARTVHRRYGTNFLDHDQHGVRFFRKVPSFEPRSLVRCTTPRPMPMASMPRAAGAFAFCKPRFDPEGLLQLIEEHRLTHLHMVPTMFVRLLKPAGRGTLEVRSVVVAVRRARCGTLSAGSQTAHDRVVGAGDLRVLRCH